jgi:hypothetical protein
MLTRTDCCRSILFIAHEPHESSDVRSPPPCPLLDETRMTCNIERLRAWGRSLRPQISPIRESRPSL